MNYKSCLLILILCLAVLAPAVAESTLPAGPGAKGMGTVLNNDGKSIEIVSVMPGVISLEIKTLKGKTVFSGQPTTGKKIDLSSHASVVCHGFTKKGLQLKAIGYRYLK